MELRINNRNINIPSQYTNVKNSNNKYSFANQLNDSIELSTNRYSNTSLYSNLGTLRNINNSNNYAYCSNEEIEKRRAEIQRIQNEYDNGKFDAQLCMPKVNTKIMEKVLDLQIKNNKDSYYDVNGKININKIAEECGISKSWYS